MTPRLRNSVIPCPRPAGPAPLALSDSGGAAPGGAGPDPQLGGPSGKAGLAGGARRVPARGGASGGCGWGTAAWARHSPVLSSAERGPRRFSVPSVLCVADPALAARWVRPLRAPRVPRVLWCRVLQRPGAVDVLGRCPGKSSMRRPWKKPKPPVIYYLLGACS